MLLENWSDKVSVYWDFSLGPVTFIANITLIIIILKYTPESTKTYSSIILTITIADCASLIGNFMTSARFFSSFIDPNDNWVCYKAFQPMDIVNQAISKYEPDIVGSGATYNGIVDLREPSQVVFNFFSVSSPIFVIMVAVFCHWRIVRFSKKFQYSDSVKKLHRSLEMVFSAQTIGPIVSFMTSMMYVGINQEGITTHTTIFFENLMTRPIVLMCVVNPIVTFFYITPYQKALRKWLRIPASIIVWNSFLDAFLW
ncbi:unnamed protein product [Caenorhabditis brenneri]